MFITLGLSILISLLIGCSSEPTQSVRLLDIVKISTKAQITDKTNTTNTTNTTMNSVSIDIFLKRNETIRLEVSALLGYPVGSLLMTRSLLQCAVHPQKYFIQGPFASRTLKPLFKQDIDPLILWSVIHAEDLKTHGFQCDKLTLNIEICRNPQFTVEIEQRGQLNSEGLSVRGQKKITLENNNIKMIWVFKSQEVLNVSQSETFVLQRPKEYKLITIK